MLEFSLPIVSCVNFVVMWDILKLIVICQLEKLVMLTIIAKNHRMIPTLISIIMAGEIIFNLSYKNNQAQNPPPQNALLQPPDFSQRFFETSLLKIH